MIPRICGSSFLSEHLSEHDICSYLLVDPDVDKEMIRPEFVLLKTTIVSSKFDSSTFREHIILEETRKNDIDVYFKDIPIKNRDWHRFETPKTVDSYKDFEIVVIKHVQREAFS